MANPSLRNRAFEDAVASFSDALEDEPSWGQLGANMQTDEPAIKSEIRIEIPFQWRSLITCNACHEHPACT